ncbi:hypothetical protein ACFE04_023124 [Oxalis oulophora]
MSSSSVDVGGGKLVCVTGASGYIASWLVKFLLQRGYTVRATVRDPNDPSKTEHLRALQGAKERLQLFKADLLDQRVFNSIIHGCHTVFHTASPVDLSLDINDPQLELIGPAVNGTLNILKLCAKTSSVKRVVFTSTFGAVILNGRPLASEVVDETWFSDPTFCKELKLWYMLSKTLAEEAAWKFAKENGIDLVTINPGYVIGPMLQPTLNDSVEMFLDIINGPETFLNNYYAYVDVRDVAHAHILASEVPSANGRYVLVRTVIHASNLLNIVREQYPTLKLPMK